MAVTLVYGQILPVSAVAAHKCLLKYTLDSGSWGTPTLNWPINDGFYCGIQNSPDGAHFLKVDPLVYEISGSDLSVIFDLENYYAPGAALLYLEAGTVSDGTNENPQNQGEAIVFSNDSDFTPVVVSSVTLESNGRTVTIVYNNPGQAEDLEHQVPDGKGGFRTVPLFYYPAGWSDVTVNTDDWDFRLKDESDNIYDLNSATLDYTVDGNDLIVTMDLLSGRLTGEPTLTFNSDKGTLYIADGYIATPRINDNDGLGRAVTNNSTWVPGAPTGPANVGGNNNSGFTDSISRIGIS